jgi:Zn-dependent protease
MKVAQVGRPVTMAVPAPGYPGSHEKVCLPGRLPVELRGKWREGSGPDQPSWPAANRAPDGTEPAEGSGSQWWPEPGAGAGAGESSSGWGSPPAPSGGLARSGYTSGPNRPQSPGQLPGARPPGPGTNGQPGTNGRPGTNGHLPARTAQGRAGTGQGKPPGVLRRAWQRFVTALAAAGAFLAKFGALLIKLKYVSVVLTMLASVAAYSLFFGWSFAVGIVLLILVHEMGHVIELRRQGVPASAPLFIPFLGAFVNMKGSPRSAYQEALSGLAGPLVGTAASIVVAFWANATSSSFLMALAFFGFFVNLFNLLPVLPLDGGRAAAALHPALWLLGLAALLVFEFLYPSPVIPIVLILGGVELWRRWRYRNSPSSRAYHALLPQQRLAIAAFYLVLVGVTIFGAHATYVARSLNL